MFQRPNRQNVQDKTARAFGLGAKTPTPTPPVADQLPSDPASGSGDPATALVIANVPPNYADLAHAILRDLQGQ